MGYVVLVGVDQAAARCESRLHDGPQIFELLFGQIGLREAPTKVARNEIHRVRFDKREIDPPNALKYAFEGALVPQPGLWDVANPADCLLGGRTLHE